MHAASKSINAYAGQVKGSFRVASCMNVIQSCRKAGTLYYRPEMEPQSMDTLPNGKKYALSLLKLNFDMV